MSKEDQKIYNECLDKINGLNALVIGDVILDRYIWGNAERISPEAPIPIVNENRQENRLGGAANVVRNLRGIGVNVDLCGYIGDDVEGKIVLDLLRQENVSTDGVLVDRLRPTSIKTRVLASNQQMLRVDREDKSQRTPVMCEAFAALVEASVKKADFSVVSDYAKGVVSKELIEHLEKLQVDGEISLQKKPIIFDPHPDNYSIYKTVCIAKPNRKEAERAVNMSIRNREEACVAVQKLMELWHSDMALITLGADGMVIKCAGDAEPVLIDTMAKKVFDVSGAGDTVTSVFVAALCAGASPNVAGNLANIAAGVVVSEVGTIPIEINKFRDAIEELK